MKKLSLFLVLCLLAGVMLSCSKTETPDAGTADSALADSASGNAAITRDDLSNFLDKLAASYSPDSSSSSASSAAAEPPVFLSLDKVKALDSSNYRAHLVQLEAYTKYAMSALTDYCKEKLPENCILTHTLGEGYDYAINVPQFPCNYFVLDPSKIPDNCTAEELVLSLEWAFHEAKNQSDINIPHGEEMEVLKERIGSVGLVYVTNGLFSYNYLYDTATDTVEEIEWFTGYSEINDILGSHSYSDLQNYVEFAMDEDATAE